MAPWSSSRFANTHPPPLCWLRAVGKPLGSQFWTTRVVGNFPDPDSGKFKLARNHMDLYVKNRQIGHFLAKRGRLQIWTPTDAKNPGGRWPLGRRRHGQAYLWGSRELRLTNQKDQKPLGHFRFLQYPPTTPCLLRTVGKPLGNQFWTLKVVGTETILGSLEPF